MVLATEINSLDILVIREQKKALSLTKEDEQTNPLPRKTLGTCKLFCLAAALYTSL